MKRLSLKNAIIVLAILSLPLLVSCKTQPVSSPEPQIQEPAIPANFTTYTDESNLYRISYPPDWELALSKIEGLQQSTKELINSINSNVPVEKASIIFFAGLPKGAGYAPNVNIVVEPMPESVSTHDKMMEMEIRGIKAVVKDYHEYSRLKTTVGGREATILDWEGTYSQAGKIHTLQLLMLVGKTGWVVSCSPTEGEMSKWEADLNSVVRSLRILK